MNFSNAAQGFPFAMEWFGALRNDGRGCMSLDFSTISDVPHEYQSAVAWHNIEQDGRLDPVEQKKFAEVIDTSWNNPSDRPSPLVKVVDREEWLPRKGLEEKYQKELCAMGPPVGILTGEEGYDRLCSLVIPKPDAPPDITDFEREERPVQKMSEGLRRDLLENILKAKGPLVWLTRYCDIEDCLEEWPSAHEALCRVGLECRVSSCLVYLLTVKTEAIRDHLRIPTVADSRLYHIFQSTQGGPTGITRHTERGKGYGVPELVVRREVLRSVYERADAAGVESPVQLDERVWSADSPRITIDHALSRWRDEIVPFI